MDNYFIRSDGVKIELISEPYCEWCSKPIAKIYKDYGLCYDCNIKLRNFNPPLVTINTVGIYKLRSAENQLSKEIWQFKKDPSLAGKLGECMVWVINNRYQFLRNMDLIVPVPNGDSEREYNQAALLAEYVSENIEIPFKDILYKKEEYPAQHTTVSLEDKCSNIKDKIGCNKEINEKRILLIDDTYITGNTKNECARVLKECGAKEIKCLIIGRSVDQTNLDFIKSLDENYE